MNILKLSSLKMTYTVYFLGGFFSGVILSSSLCMYVTSQHFIVERYFHVAPKQGKKDSARRDLFKRQQLLNPSPGHAVLFSAKTISKSKPIFSNSALCGQTATLLLKLCSNGHSIWKAVYFAHSKTLTYALAHVYHRFSTGRAR